MTACPACGSERAVVIALTRNPTAASSAPEMFVTVRRRYNVCGNGPAPSGSTIWRFGATLVATVGSSRPTCNAALANGAELKFSGPGTPSIDGNAEPAEPVAPGGTTSAKSAALSFVSVGSP